MIKGAEPITSKDFNKGLVTRSDFLKGDINASPNTMDVQWNFDSSLHKRLGSSSTNSVTLGSTSLAGWTIDSNGTLSTSLVSYWKLDESSNTRMDSADGNNLIDVNSTGTIVGIRGNAALFVAANSNALLGGNPTNLQTGNVNFSMSSWVYLNSTSTTIERSIISKKDPDIDAATVLLLHFEGTNSSQTIIDSSPSNKTVTVFGSAAISTVVFKIGSGAGNFEGTNSYLSVASSNDFNMGTGDFTVDFWAYLNSITQTQIFQYGQSITNQFDIDWNNSTAQLEVSLASHLVNFAWSPSTATWYHIAVSRQAGNLMAFVNGSQIGSTVSNNDNVPVVGLNIGHGNTPFFSGLMDEFRVTKGVARYTGPFTPPSVPYSVQNYEYWLYINTNQQATFRVSSTGSNQTATVQATSIGALNTSTWYRIVGWHSNNSHIGIDVNLSVNTAAYVGGVKAGNAPFLLGANSASITAQGTTYIDGRIDETGFWSKVLSSQERNDLYGGGTGNTFSPGQSGFSWASFDFGASNLRWLTVASGTGLYASSNRGTNFVVIGTTRTQTYQSLNRSKNVLIATSDAYDVPLYWAGSAGTFASILAANSAPSAKFSTNYQGFLILLNFKNSAGVLRNRGFAYADENLQITDPWTNSFDIPSSADDEITSSFILYKFLYVSTRYTIYRVAFVGGNPDWSYLKVKDWGFVPRTVQIVSLKGGGQVAIGMDWDRRLRAFDGFDDMFISDNVENDNQICDFAMQKVSYAGSGLVVSHAVLNPVTQEYRLNVAIGAASSQTTHGIILNARNLAMYPYSNQGWQTMCVAESNNQRALMAFDRSGFCYILDSGNLDSMKPINEVYDSPPLFSKIPEAVSKGKQLNMFFAPQSSGTIYYQERYNLSNIWSSMKPLSDQYGVSNMTGTENAIKLQRCVDVKATYNTYQFRITSSAGTADPWQMDRLDFLQQGFGIGQG